MATKTIKRYAQVKLPGWQRKQWVGLGERPADDSTLPVVTHAYATRQALQDAVANGSAWLPPIRRFIPVTGRQMVLPGAYRSLVWASPPWR